MNKYVNNVSVIVLITCAVTPSLAQADVYGGGFWETIGLGNMQCEEYLAKSNEPGFKELGAFWLSGFLSGINFTSTDVYDITWGEDIYVLTDLMAEGCEQQPNKVLADIASEMVYQRYQDKNFTASKDIKKEQQ